MRVEYMDECNLVWYNSVDTFVNPSRFKGIEDPYRDYPGYDNMCYMNAFFAQNLSLTDRTNSIRYGVKTKIYPGLELPKFEKKDLNFEQLCNQRARDLLDKAIKSNRKLAIMFSGGIDSTLIMVSLFKIASDLELRKYVTVLLSPVSIVENPNLYYNYILKKCEVESSFDFDVFQGHKKYIVVNGESGDQLFGSAVIKNILDNYGIDFIFSHPTKDKINLIFDKQLKLSSQRGGSLERRTVNLETIINALDKITMSAPFEIKTIYHYFWWINFTQKWQSVYLRSVAFTNKKNHNTIIPEDNYFIFFNTKEMQLWSLNNTDKLIKDEWRTYKYVMKDIIYDFDKNKEYRDTKVKRGSLIRVVVNKPLVQGLSYENSKVNFHINSLPDDIWNENNDFV